MASYEVTDKSWFQRIGESVGGIIFGLILFVVAFPLLFWNEGRAVKTARGLEEGAANVVDVSDKSVEKANDGKLVHLTGEATTTEKLSDPEFDVAAQAIRLERVVEMYQWVEHKRTKKRKNFGGGQRTKTEYTYSQEWKSSPVSSSGFYEPGHDNPSQWPFKAMTAQASRVNLGAFQLTPALVQDIDQYTALPVSESNIPSNARSLKKPINVYQGGLYYGDTPGQPQIGDLKISFRAVKPTTVSVVAQQTGKTFQAYQPEEGNPINMLTVGTASAKQMFDQAKHENMLFTWGLRLGGFLAMAIGIGLLFQPFVVLADFIPLLGNLVGMGVALFAALVALPLSLITIAIGWISYRPLVGGILIGAAVLIFVGVALLRRKSA